MTTHTLPCYGHNRHVTGLHITRYCPLRTLEALTGESLVFVVVVRGARCLDRKGVKVHVVIDLHRLNEKKKHLKK